MPASFSRCKAALAAALTALCGALFSLLALAVLFTTHREPEDYSFTIRPSRLFLCALCWGLLLLLAALLCRRFKPFLLRYEKPVAAVLLGLLFVGCLVVGYLLEVATLNDVQTVFETARQLAEGGGVPEKYQWYYYIYPNNVGTTVFLAGWLRLTGLVGLRPGLACLLLGALLTAAAAAFLYLLVRQLAGVGSALLCLGGFLCCPPVYAYTAVYYSDTLALPFGIGALWLYSCGCRAAGRRRAVSWLLCGLMLGVGMALKMSVAVLAVALFLHALLAGGLRGAARRLAWVGGAVLLCLLLNRAATCRLLPDETLRQTRPLPYNHWVMMGLTGDGRWNGSDENFSAHFEDHDLAEQANWERIGERIRQHGPAGMLQLLGKKTLYSFGDGSFNVSSMLDDIPLRPGFLHGILLYTSPHFMLFFYLCTGLYLLLLTLGALGAIQDLLRRRAAPDLALVLRLAFFGLWLFLMLWESNARYLYHYLPILYGCAFCSFGPAAPAQAPAQAPAGPAAPKDG